VADIGTLTALVSVFGFTPERASVPALVAGSVVVFVGHKYFVFGAHDPATIWRETILFTLIQVIGIALSAWAFQAILGMSPRLQAYYVPVRLVANNFVWLFYYFPLWHFVFKKAPRPAAAAELTPAKAPPR
jgi:putative flippase GtrA